MKLIANQTIHLNSVKPADPKIAGDRPKFTQHMIAPGESFDTSKFDMTEDDAAELVSSGVARRPARDDAAPKAAPAEPANPAPAQSGSRT
jgi:hypothetical protein